MELLNSDNREQLEAQGFGIAELTGFEDHTLPLYAHRKMADKEPGDVVVRARIGNPESLDSGEATYLARKAFHGLFPWLPGADCLKRTFANVTISSAVGTARKNVERTDPVNGCKWCRERTAARVPAHGPVKSVASAMSTRLRELPQQVTRTGHALQDHQGQ